MNRWDIINHFIKKHGYTNYLEIGYYKGWSFDQVKCLSKTAVDPNPCKSIPQEQAPYGQIMGHYDVGQIYKVTSDDFFKEYAFVGGMERKWDIIFIDGLHEASQVYKDTQNALKHLSDNGVIVLHDCNPPRYEHTTTGIDGCWTGDTYKAVLKLQAEDIFGHYSFYTVDTDWGCGVLKKNSIVIESMQNMNKFYAGITNWGSFDRNRTKLLNLISVEEFLKRESSGDL